MEKLFYLAQVFDGLHALFVAAVVISGILVGIAVLAIPCSEFDDDVVPKCKQMIKKYTPVLIIGALGIIFTPTKETFLFMIGGKAVDTLVENNPEVSEIPSNTINLLNEYIKSETEKIRRKEEK